MHLAEHAIHQSVSRKDTSMSDIKPEQAPKKVITFEVPTLVRFNDATRFLWGDNEAQYVNDYIYGKNSKIGCVVFTLRPGAFFKVSSAWKPFYKQHRFYYVVQGELTIHDPETGDVVIAKAGEAVHWRGAKWHFGYNFSQEEVFVLDWYAPQERPQHITEQEFAKTKPNLAEIVDGRWDLLNTWPEAFYDCSGKNFQNGSVVKLTRDHAVNVVHGTEHPVLERIFVSTPELTGGTVDLLPAQRSDNQSHPGEKIIFSLKGRVNVYLPETYDWFELLANDVLYLPANVQHQYWNYSDKPSSFAFQVVPAYR